MKKQLFAIIAASLLVAAACDKKEAPEAEPTAPTAPTEEPAAAAAEPEKPAVEEVAVATIDKPAPDFELADEKGQKHKLSDLKGKMVVLEWTNPECPVVQRVYGTKTMQASIKELGAEVAWLAIDSSNFVKPEDSQKWAAEHSVDWPQLQDPTGEVGKKYDAKTTPHMFVIDKEGILRYAGAIDNDPHGKLEEGKKNYVVEAVKALTAGTEVADKQTKPYGCSVKYGS